MNLLKIFGLVFLMTLLSLLLVACNDADGGCGGQSQAANYARSLTSERLSRLFVDFEKLAADKNVERVYSSYGVGAKMPSEFSDLNVVKLRPKSGYIIVNGCVDHGVIMTFRGLNEKGEEKSIDLSWGEAPPHSGSETLWKR